MLSDDLSTRSHLKRLQSVHSAAMVIRKLLGFELWGLDAAALFTMARYLLVREALCLLPLGYRCSIRGREDNTHIDDSA